MALQGGFHRVIKNPCLQLLTIIYNRYIVYYYFGIAMLFGDASLSIVELIATIGNQELTLSSAELFYHSFPHNDFYHNKVPQN